MARIGETVAGMFFVLGGAAVAAALLEWRARTDNLEGMMRSLEERLAANQSGTAREIHEIKESIERQDARIAELPAARDLVTLVDELLESRVQAIGARLNAQRDSIEVIRSAVSQTDQLIGRVLESLESLGTAGRERETSIGMG